MSIQLPAHWSSQVPVEEASSPWSSTRSATAPTFFGLIGIFLWVTFRIPDAGPIEVNAMWLAVGLLTVAGVVKDRTAGLPLLALILLLALPSLVLIQLIPLPVGLLRAASPVRAETVEALAQVGGPTRWATLSGHPSQTFVIGLWAVAFVAIFLLVSSLFETFRSAAWLLVSPLVWLAALDSLFGLISVSVGGDFREPCAGIAAPCLPFVCALAVWTLRQNPSRWTSPVGPALRACLLLTVAAALTVLTVISKDPINLWATCAALCATATVAWNRWLGGAVTAGIAIAGLSISKPSFIGSETGTLLTAIIAALLVRAWFLAARAASMASRSAGRYLGFSCAGSLTGVALESCLEPQSLLPHGIVIAWVLAIAESLALLQRPAGGLTEIVPPGPFDAQRTPNLVTVRSWR